MKILTNTHAVLVLEIYATGKRTSSSARMTLFHKQTNKNKKKLPTEAKTEPIWKRSAVSAVYFYKTMNNRKDKHVTVLVHYLMKTCLRMNAKLQELLIPAT
jgi:hypothetical protein